MNELRESPPSVLVLGLHTRKQEQVEWPRFPSDENNNTTPPSERRPSHRHHYLWQRQDHRTCTLTLSSTFLPTKLPCAIYNRKHQRYTHSYLLAVGTLITMAYLSFFFEEEPKMKVMVKDHKASISLGSSKARWPQEQWPLLSPAVTCGRLPDCKAS